MIAATGFDFEVIRGYSRSDYHALEVSLEKKIIFEATQVIEVKNPNIREGKDLISSKISRI